MPVEEKQELCLVLVHNYIQKGDEECTTLNVERYFDDIVSRSGTMFWSGRIQIRRGSPTGCLFSNPVGWFTRGMKDLLGFPERVCSIFYMICRGTKHSKERFAKIFVFVNTGYETFSIHAFFHNISLVSYEAGIFYF